MLILKSENNFQSDAAELLSNLEKCRKEYENLKSEKQKYQRSKQEEQLLTTIEMRESIEQLKEETLLKNE